MKKIALLFLFLLATLPSVYGANGTKFHYSSSYSSFESGFNSTYTMWDENEQYEDCGSRLCYGDDWGPNQTVYVEEVIIDHGPHEGYTRTVVYRDSGYSRPYVEYYSYNKRIVRRRFHSRHRYNSLNVVHCHHNHVTVDWVVLDEFTASMIIATAMVEIGVNVLDGCSSDSECIAGMASVALGSMSSSAAIDNELNKSDLYQKINHAEADASEESEDI